MQNVVIDCDPGIDDTLALIYAIKNPNFNVKAITIVSGNVVATKGYKNAQYVLSMLGRKDIPIYVGHTSDDYINAEDTHGYNGLGNFDYTQFPYDDTNSSVQPELADQFLSKIKKEDDITLIALGPLTNIWRAYALNPMFFNNISFTVIMGGAYRTHGNCTPVSEYNFWCDPQSAKKVFEVMSKVIIVPLDATRKIVLTPEKVKAIKCKNYNIGNFIEKITAYYIDFHRNQEGIYGCVINDPLAVFVSEGYLAYTKDLYAMVCGNTSGVTRGQMIVDAGNMYHKIPNCSIVYKVTDNEVDMFWDRYIEIICK